jgi:hypothetical protein
MSDKEGHRRDRSTVSGAYVEGRLSRESMVFMTRWSTTHRATCGNWHERRMNVAMSGRIQWVRLGRLRSKIKGHATNGQHVRRGSRGSR